MFVVLLQELVGIVRFNRTDSAQPRLAALLPQLEVKDHFFCTVYCALNLKTRWMNCIHCDDHCSSLLLPKLYVLFRRNSYKYQ